MKKIIIIGASGHGKVIANIVESNGDKVIGFLDDDTSKREVLHYPVLGTVSQAEEYSDCEFVVAIGDNHTRKRIVEQHPTLKYHIAIHPQAIIDPTVKIGDGTVVMANAVINADSRIGRHCIINTGAVIEHDNRIEDYVHISPHATLCGTVEVGELTHIGAGAVVKNNVLITEDVIMGAGSVVVKDLIEQGIYIGVPVKKKS